MIQLLNDAQEFETFEVAPNPQTIRRQTSLAPRQSKPQTTTANPYVIRTTDQIADYRRKRREGRIDMFCSTVVAAYFGLATLAIGYFLLNGF